MTEVLADFEQTMELGWNVLRDERHHEIRVLTRMKAALTRLAPPNSAYLSDDVHSNNMDVSDCGRIAGVLQALLADYQGNYLQTFLELARADLYGDFLSQAELLLSQDHLKDPAAVLAGGVLEEHLRKLCNKYGVSLVATNTVTGQQFPKKLDTMNADLTKQRVYGMNEQKQITAWADLRNNAAHGHTTAYTANDVGAFL
ncbi:MAG: hypothetical protein H7062_00390, partial [Candidatus Saccharimonas sp.]|nr:hypothetical protein [Planctomycetaceae bacterium]